jgi:hypothetical protein
MPDNEQLKKALAEQETRLRNLDKELRGYDALRRERDNVFTLVSTMRFTLGMNCYVPPAEDETPSEALKPPTGVRILRPIWAVAKELLEKANRPMSSAELAEALFGLGFTQLVGRPGKETVRALLNKKKNVFERVEGGNFILKERRAD